MTFTTGMMIGKYELGKKLGQGGFGLVFVARDTGLDREVALKFMHPEHTSSPEILRRFLQEARSAAKIVHPGIVTVFECGQVAGTGTSSDGVAFIAMELLHGESLSDRLSRAGRLPFDHAMEITRQVASALEAAHAAGIIHRDLKPDNIFLVRDPAMPGGERVKVLDFGIAKLAQGANTSGVQTQSMMVFGTPRYMSPEQCRSAAHIDHRSDIYTLGCILYELVTGTAPFTGETGELIAKHQLVPPMTAKSIIGDLPEHLDELIKSMLAKNPADRPQTMAAVQRALEARGAMAPGVAPTLLPDGVAPTLLPGESAPRLAPPARASSEPKRASAPIAAAASPTTLGGASGQWSEVIAPRRSKAPIVIGAAVAVAALAGGGIYLAREKVTDSKTAAAPPAALPAQGSAGQSAPQIPDSPPAPAEIELTIDATPKAEVWVGNLMLGETPHVEKRKPQAGKLEFVLKAPGHQDKRVLVPADRAEQHRFTLDPIPAVATTPDKKPPRKPPDKKPADKTKKVLKPGDLPDE